MKITLIHGKIKTIRIDVRNTTKANLKQYTKKLQEYTQIGSIYPWYVTSNFSLVHTGSWFVDEHKKDVLTKLDNEYAFIQNAINCYYGTHEKIKENV